MKITLRMSKMPNNFGISFLQFTVITHCLFPLCLSFQFSGRMKRLASFTFVILLVALLNPANPVGFQEIHEDGSKLEDARGFPSETETEPDTLPNETDEGVYAEEEEFEDPDFVAQMQVKDPAAVDDENEIDKRSPKPWGRFRVRFRRAVRSITRGVRRLTRRVTRIVRRAVRRVSRIIRRTVRKVRRTLKRITRFRVKRIGNKLKGLVTKVILKIKKGKPSTEPNPPPGETCGEACQLRKRLLGYLKFFSQAYCSFTAVQRYHSIFFVFRNTDTNLQMKVNQLAGASLKVYKELSAALKKLDKTYAPIERLQLIRQCLDANGQLLPCSGGQGIISVFKDMKCIKTCGHFDAASCQDSDRKLRKAIADAENAFQEKMNAIGST